MTDERTCILITGGTGGIGRALVERLAATHPVAFTWRSSEEEAGDIERAAAAAGRMVVGIRADLADPDAADRVVEEAEERLGTPTALVNNAGLRRDGLLAMMPDEDWDAVIGVNLTAVFRCCRAVMRGMIARRGGAIVNISSLSATHGVSGQTAYAAAKAGVLGMTRALAREMGGKGVRVNAVVPGYVAGGMTDDVTEEQEAALRRGEVLPGGVEPDAVADAVEFLLSERAASITGQTLTVDAGTSA